MFVAFLATGVLTPSNIIEVPFFLWIARIIAFVFMVLQTAIVVDVSMSVNERILGLEEVPTDQWTFLKMLLLSLSLALFVLVFIMYSSIQTSDHHSGVYSLISICLIGVFVYCQLFNTTGSGNLFTSSVVATYVMYLTKATVDPHSAVMLFGLVSCFDMIGLAMCLWSSLALAMTDGGEAGESEARGVSYGSVGGQDSVPVNQDKYEAVFNLWMFLITCASTMNLSNFGCGGVGCADGVEVVVMWGYMLAAWLGAALYIWILLAPQLFPDRVY